MSKSSKRQSNAFAKSVKSAAKPLPLSLVFPFSEAATEGAL